VIKAIASNSIDAWLERLASDAVVFVPQRRSGGDVVLEPMSPGERTTEYRRLAESPKRILLPQVDALVRFEKERGQPVLDVTERILFGLRPCDAAAVAILDEFFRRDYPDPNYLGRRERMRLIVSACKESEETCFCISAGTGPVAVDGFDVQLFDLGEMCLGVSATKEGEQLIARGGELFTDPPTDAEQKIEKFRQRSEATQQTRLDLQTVQKVIRERGEPDDFWEKVAARCLMCGGCAYLCPTCTCYNVADRPTAPGEGVRRRLWDSCVFAGFTREAGGHNPREQQPLRCAFRYFHKLGGSDVPQRAFRCVGCGRCAAACISRLGIIRVVEELLEQVRGKKQEASKKN
jgi:formate hydrogenlyase subunit 6/NADH:ubiquinone oxidoreductase subunit I